MSSLEITPKEMDLKVYARDHINSTSVFPVDDSGSNNKGKRKEILECSSRSSVSETEESLLTPSPLETNSSPIYNPGQHENQSRKEIPKRASSLLRIWEARSQLSSSSQSQSLIKRRKSSGLSLFDDLSSFSKSLNNNNGEERDWWSQLERSHVSDSNEKEKEGKHYLGMVTCTPRIRGRQAYEDLFKKILHDRKEELKSIASTCQVSEFSSHRSSQLKFMLKIRCLERGIAIQERQWLKRRDEYKKNTGKVNSVVEDRTSSSSVSSREKKVEDMAKKAAEKNVLQDLKEEVKKTVEKRNMREAKDATCKTEIYKKSLDTSNKNGLKEPEKIERDTKEEGEMSREAIAEEKVEGNKSPLSIADKVNLWDSKSKARTNRRKTPEKAKNEEKTARRRVTSVETTESENEEVSSFGRGKSIETEKYGISPQEVTPVIFMDKRKKEETRSQESSESVQEEESSQENEETVKAEKLQALESLCMIFESPSFLSGWDENKMTDGEEEEEDAEEEYNQESEYYDWVSNISNLQPRSYWEDERKQWELAVMNYGEPEKKEIQDMIMERTVTRILASDLREEINKILISQAKRLEVESNPEEEQDSEESLVECSESNHGQVEEQDTISVGFSQSSSKSTMMMRNFEDHEAAITVTSSPKDHDNTSYEFKLICDLKDQVEKLQREMLELRSLVESSVDFKKSMKLESASGVDICDERL